MLKAQGNHRMTGAGNPAIEQVSEAGATA